MFHNTLCRIAICSWQSGCASQENVKRNAWRWEMYYKFRSMDVLWKHVMSLLTIMCFVKTWQEKQSYPIFTIYLNYHVMYSFFTYLKKKKNLSQSQKSLEEYFSSHFRCIYSIYIHSRAHVWHPLKKKKVFLLIVWKECLTSIIHFFHRASHSAAAYPTLKGFVNHCRFQQIKHISFKL